MENLTNTAVHLLEDSQGADLTRREKRKLSVEITTAMIALVCLVTGLLYKGIFPEQTAVAGLIYSVGVLVEGLPLLATAIRGFLQRDVTNAMEILLHHWAARAGHPDPSGAQRGPLSGGAEHHGRPGRHRGP